MSKQSFSGQIRKAVLTEKNTLAVSFVDNMPINGDFANAKTSKKWDQEVHKDLKTHFNFLKGHAAAIGCLFQKGVEPTADYLRKRDCAIDTSLIDYEVRGFEFKGDINDDDPDKTNLQVRIFMRRNLPMGGHYDFALPFVKLYNGSDYEFSGILVDDLDDCMIETARYVDGKFKDSSQLKLVFDGEGEDESDY